MTDKDLAAPNAGEEKRTFVADTSNELKFVDELPGETLHEKLDALHARHFDGTALTTHTTLWNMVHAFKEDVKKLLPQT